MSNMICVTRTRTIEESVEAARTVLEPPNDWHGYAESIGVTPLSSRFIFTPSSTVVGQIIGLGVTDEVSEYWHLKTAIHIRNGGSPLRWRILQEGAQLTSFSNITRNRTFIIDRMPSETRYWVRNASDDDRLMFSHPSDTLLFTAPAVTVGGLHAFAFLRTDVDELS